MYGLIEIILCLFALGIILFYQKTAMTTSAYAMLLIITTLLLILTVNYQIKDLLEVLSARVKY